MKNVNNLKKYSEQNLSRKINNVEVKLSFWRSYKSNEVYLNRVNNKKQIAEDIDKYVKQIN